MVKKLESIERWFRIGAIVVLIGLVIAGAVQLYGYYTNKVGATAEKALYAWIQALAAGDSDEVYRMTARDRLTDIYGRPVTASEFRRQVSAVTGDEALPLQLTRLTRLADESDACYFLVELATTGGSAPGGSRMLMEVTRQAGVWLVTWPFAIVL